MMIIIYHKGVTVLLMCCRININININDIIDINKRHQEWVGNDRVFFLLQHSKTKKVALIGANKSIQSHAILEYTCKGHQYREQSLQEDEEGARHMWDQGIFGHTR